MALTGPVTVRADAAAARARAWQAAWAPVEAALAARPDLSGWWRGEVDSGLPRRLAAGPAAGAVLARDLVAVLERLPAPGVAIGALAHAATGSAHGLDAGPLATLALRAARVLAGLPPGPRSASGDREAWAAVGVVRDELSSTVLTLALPAHATGATGAALGAWARAGQPVVLTLRHLRLDPPSWRPAPAGAVVWTCENPVVLAAVADAWSRGVGAGQASVGQTSVGRAAGSDGPAALTAPPPMVCTAGQPSAAATAVLRGLADAGWALRHHGDLDPDGVRITNRLVGDLGAVPWRMGVEDYEAALAAGLGRSSGRVPVAAVWDERLGPVMARSGQVVEEEAVLDALVADLVPGALPAGGAAGTERWSATEEDGPDGS